MPGTTAMRTRRQSRSQTAQAKVAATVRGHVADDRRRDRCEVPRPALRELALGRQEEPQAHERQHDRRGRERDRDSAAQRLLDDPHGPAAAALVRDEHGQHGGRQRHVDHQPDPRGGHLAGRPARQVEVVRESQRGDQVGRDEDERRDEHDARARPRAVAQHQRQPQRRSREVARADERRRRRHADRPREALAGRRGREEEPRSGAHGDRQADDDERPAVPGEWQRCLGHRAILDSCVRPRVKSGTA